MLSTTYFAQEEHIKWPDSDTRAIISPLPHVGERSRVRGAQALAAPSPKPSQREHRDPFGAAHGRLRNPMGWTMKDEIFASLGMTGGVNVRAMTEHGSLREVPPLAAVC